MFLRCTFPRRCVGTPSDTRDRQTDAARRQADVALAFPPPHDQYAATTRGRRPNRLQMVAAADVRDAERQAKGDVRPGGGRTPSAIRCPARFLAVPTVTFCGRRRRGKKARRRRGVVMVTASPKMLSVGSGDRRGGGSAGGGAFNFAQF